ncbi:MAG: zf-HC2 domain-containing protein [Oscillospiraceae bacterium]|nr:zf-HC2 domain-containing protein [Oscillospiraceae bacterium]
MDKTCSIVQDLLPLYEEDMLREETKEFVDGHLAQCAACRAELDALKADVKPVPVSAQPLRDLKRQLRRKKLTAVLLAVTLALTLAAAGFAYLTAPQYLPYSETEWTVARADGAVTAEGLADLSGVESISVNLLTPVSGAKVTSTQEPDSGKTVYFITAWRTPLDTWRGAFDKTGDAPNAHSANDRTQREADALQGALGKVESARTLFTLDTANCAAVYYSPNNGQDDVLLCGSRDGGIISLPRLALGYYVLLSLALLIPLSIAFFLCRRKKAGKALGHLALIPACYLVGHLLVKGFVTTSYQMQRDFSLIILAAALLYAAALLAGTLLRQRRDTAE